MVIELTITTQLGMEQTELEPTSEGYSTVILKITQHSDLTIYQYVG